MHSVTEDTALRMIASFEKFQCFSFGQNRAPSFSQSREIFGCEKAGTGISPDQFFDSAHAVADNNGEDFFGDGKDVPSRFVRKTVVEDANLVRAGCVALANERRGRALQILVCLMC